MMYTNLSKYIIMGHTEFGARMITIDGKTDKTSDMGYRKWH